MSEQIMQTHRKQHWATVYREKALDRVSWFEETPRTSLALLRAQGLTPDDAVIDIGGGSSRLVDALLSQGQAHVSVLDISEAALEARGVDWIVSDVTQWTPRKRYDFWHDRASFHFLTEDADRMAYRKAMTLALRPGGIAVIGTFAKDGPERCSELPVQRHDAKSLKAAMGPAFTLVAESREKHPTPSGVIQRFQFVALRYEG